MRGTVVVLAVLAVAAVAVAPTGATETGTAAGNEPPLADAGLDQQVDPGTTVLVDATGSRDPDGTVAEYAWRIEAPNGSTVLPACPDCARTRFTPRRTGTYEVDLTVTDDAGASSTDRLYVTVRRGEATPTGTPTPEGATATPGGPGPAAPAGDRGPPGPPLPIASDPGGDEPRPEPEPDVRETEPTPEPAAGPGPAMIPVSRHPEVVGAHTAMKYLAGNTSHVTTASARLVRDAVDPPTGPVESAGEAIADALP